MPLNDRMCLIQPCDFKSFQSPKCCRFRSDCSRCSICRKWLYSRDRVSKTSTIWRDSLSFIACPREPSPIKRMNTQINLSLFLVRPRSPSATPKKLRSNVKRWKKLQEMPSKPRMRQSKERKFQNGKPRILMTYSQEKRRPPPRRTCRLCSRSFINRQRQSRWRAT